MKQSRSRLILDPVPFYTRLRPGLRIDRRMMSDLVRLSDYVTMPIVILLLFACAPLDWAWPLLFVAGVVVWTLAEYWLHWAFHRSIFRAAHMRHHQHPRNLSEGTLYSVSLTALLVVASWRWNVATPAVQGLLFGYLAYITIHLLHHRTRWAHRVLPSLMRNHDIHHHGPSNRRFGVTTIVWDRVFGTL